MRLFLFLLFVGLPLAELALIIKVGQVAGFWTTLGLIVGMAILGILLLQRQGLGVMRRASEALSAGKPPVAPLVDGVFLSAAALLLITPGFLSDILGLMLLVPPLRRGIARQMLRWMIGSGQVRMATYGAAHRRREGGGRGPSTVIDTEFERLDEKGFEVKGSRPPKRQDDT